MNFSNMPLQWVVPIGWPSGISFLWFEFSSTLDDTSIGSLIFWPYTIFLNEILSGGYDVSVWKSVICPLSMMIAPLHDDEFNTLLSNLFEFSSTLDDTSIDSLIFFLTLYNFFEKNWGRIWCVGFQIRFFGGRAPGVRGTLNNASIQIQIRRRVESDAVEYVWYKKGSTLSSWCTRWSSVDRWCWKDERGVSNVSL